MTFERSWVLAAAALPLVWMLLEWRRTTRRFGLALKALCFAAILVALAEPRLNVFETKVAVAVLVDTSAGVTPADLERASRLAAQLPSERGRHWMRVIPFARSTRPLSRNEDQKPWKFLPTAGENGRDQYAADFSLYVHAPLDAKKSRKRLGNVLGQDAAPMRHRGCGKRVKNIVAAGRIERDFAERPATMRDAEAHGFAFVAHRLGNPVVRLAKSVGFHGAEGLLDRSPQRRAGLLGVAPNHDAPAPRHQVHKAFEREFVRRKIRIDIGMIVFERRDDQIVRVIVEEFRTTVPERRLVLVPFQNELLAAAKSVALAEVFRDSAHQKIRPSRSGLKNPRQHGRRGRLAVRAAHDDRMLAGKEDFFKNFRQRPVG